jgi:hypothetical protein
MEIIYTMHTETKQNGAFANPKNSAASDSLHLFRILATTLKCGVIKIARAYRANRVIIVRFYVLKTYLIITIFR